LNPIWPAPSWFDEWLGSLDPMTWSRRTSMRGSGGEAELRWARYLAVTQATQIVFPEERGDVYVPGFARLHTRVLSLPGGELVCEGLSFATRTGTVEGRGKGYDDASAKAAADESLTFHIRVYFVEAVHYGPLAHLCSAGGATFCDLVRREAPNAR
jgi:hypothetical protein